MGKLVITFYKYKVIFLVFCLLLSGVKSNYANNFFNFKTPVPTLSLSLGTHEISLGFHFNISLEIPYTNFTLQNATRYYFKSPGSEKKGFESRLEGGINIGLNPRKDSLLINVGYSPWHFKNQVGYAYVYYWDQFGTSQASGIFRLKLHNFHYQIENDFFAFQSKDRYRTGAFYIAWQIKDHWIYLKNLGYTGDPYDAGVPRINDPNFPAKWGYTDMRKAPMGNKSLGVLCLGWAIGNQHKILQPYQLAFEAGIDAEKIRNYLQNRLIHDSKWINNPKRGTTNPHIPMLDAEGKPYIYAPHQAIRKPKPYVQVFVNDFFLY